MKYRIFIIIALLLLGAGGLNPERALGGTDEYENLSFFLDRALKKSSNPEERREIMQEYTIKMLGLIYKQNEESLRIDRQMLETLQELLKTEREDKRELEIQLQELRNQGFAR